MARQIVLDTETTGISYEAGHRLIEIAGVELVNRKLTNAHFHTYLNPKRRVDEGAFRVHGIGDDFLRDKPEFKSVAKDFLEFIDKAELIIHNAVFDLGFLDAELRAINHHTPIASLCAVVDTLVLARKKHPGQRNSLDALCKRYAVDNSHRELHGALLDAQILAQVYLAMTGGQTDLFAESEQKEQSKEAMAGVFIPLSSHSPVQYADIQELQRHHDFMSRLLQGDKL